MVGWLVGWIGMVRYVSVRFGSVQSRALKTAMHTQMEDLVVRFSVKTDTIVWHAYAKYGAHAHAIALSENASE